MPDLPGCAAIGRTLSSTKRRIRTVIEMHVAALRADGDPVPEPTTATDYIEVPEVAYASQKELR